MTASADWARVKQLFQDALDVAPDARLAFVKERAGNALVLQEVMSLLQTHPAPDGFLSTPPDSAQVRAVLAQLQAGDDIGPFRITGLIGVGGMGEVYRAWDTRLDRQVAIKVLPQASRIDEAGRERFEAEARAISRLTHPRISTLYDVGSALVGSTCLRFLVMELVEGETLAARIKRGPLPVDQALAIAIDIAEALAAAHAAGVIHRDVKPANVMLTRSGAKLLDFGLARLRPSLGADHTSVGGGDRTTQPTGLCGTLPYMAPELLQGAGADARTDLFAFGAVLYEMLAGRSAFAAPSEADLIPAILEREPPPVSTRQPLTPAPLERLIATCLAKDPDERWQTSQDLVDDPRTAEAVLPGEKAFVIAADWSRDGRYLLCQIEREGNTDLEVVTLGADPHERRSFVGSAAREIQAQFAPDGKWIADTSDQSGAPEVYVRHFPDTGAKWQISTQSGVQGRWRGDGKELFYLATDGKLMAVDIKASASSFEAGTPHSLFDTGIAGSFVDRLNQYLVTRDGQRVLVNRSADDENAAPITVVMNWNAARRP